MANRWLQLHGYEQQCVRGSGPEPHWLKAQQRPLAGPEFASPSRPSVPRLRNFWRTFGGIAALAGNLANLAVAFLALHLFTPHPAYIPISSTWSDKSLLDSVMVERASSVSGARVIVTAKSPSTFLLFNRWNRGVPNGGSARREHGLGQMPKSSEHFYIAAPRRNLEHRFEQLQDRGFESIQLNLIAVAAKLTEREIRLYKLWWARHCRIEPEWIDMWSSFRRDRFSRTLTNECVPGGICIVLSQGPCDAGAFQGLGEL